MPAQLQQPAFQIAYEQGGIEQHSLSALPDQVGPHPLAFGSMVTQGNRFFFIITELVGNEFPEIGCGQQGTGHTGRKGTSTPGQDRQAHP